MLTNQKALFQLDEEVTYLNGAYMSPQLKSISEIGRARLSIKEKPYEITRNDFFSDKKRLRDRFARLIQAKDPNSIAIIPSVSFGIATAVQNISFSKGDEIVVLEEQFPSNFYSWKALEVRSGVVVKTVVAPKLKLGKGAQWNKDLLAAITPKTKCVAIPHVHWTDGTLFDLKAVRKKATAVNAYLIIDGTQSVGALPFSVEEIMPDALICAGYKWLLGPYGLGVAYFGERLDSGIPIDNNWMNHKGAEDFKNLVDYKMDYAPKASRYDVGESSNFILVPMLSEGIRQLLEWDPQRIQAYCKSITDDPLDALRDKGVFVEETSYRSSHLFGIYVPDSDRFNRIQDRIEAANIKVSFRGDALRVSPSIYNDKQELEKLISCFE